MKRPYMILSAERNTYKNFGFMGAQRRHFETLKEAESWAEERIEAYKSYNWEPRCYRIKNKETGEIIKEYI